MAKVTQDFSDRIKAKKSFKFHYFLQLSVVAIVLYTPETLNTNIEQENRNMPHAHTPQEAKFLEYFRCIDKRAIKEIFTQYRSTKRRLR